MTEESFGAFISPFNFVSETEIYTSSSLLHILPLFVSDQLPPFHPAFPCRLHQRHGQFVSRHLLSWNPIYFAHRFRGQDLHLSQLYLRRSQAANREEKVVEKEQKKQAGESWTLLIW